MRDPRFWRWRRAEDDDFDREIDLHLELAAEERAEQGLPPRAARLEARRAFGSVALTKEDLRAMRPGAAIGRLLTQAFRDFRHGLRLLRQAPGFTAVAALVLGLPIAVSSVVFSLVNTVLLQPRPGRIDTLVSVFSHDRQQPDSYRSFSYPLYVELRDRSAIFESVMARSLALAGIREGDTVRRSFVEIVSANFFATLGVPLVAGRPFTLEEERPGAGEPVAIASYAAWRRRGFEPAFVGSQIRVNGTPFTIVGVAPDGLRSTPVVAVDWYFPLGTYDRVMNEWFRDGPRGLDDRANHALLLAGALASGLTRTAAESALNAVAGRLAEEFPRTDRDRVFTLAGLSRLDLSESPPQEGRVAFAVGLLTLMSGLVLAIACLNLANLMLARGAARRREIGIRQALGGGRGRIVAQLVMEGLSLSMIGAAAGLLLSWWAHAALTAWLAGALRFIATDGVEFTVDPSMRMAVVTVGLAAFSTVCFALGPAWRLSRPSVTADLKDEPWTVGRRFGSGMVPVAIQLTVSLGLLGVGGLFVRSALEVAAAGPGFAIDRLLVFAIDPSFGAYDEARTRDLYRSVLQRVDAIPGIEQASLASKIAFGEFVESGFVTVPERKTQEMTAGFTIVTSAYFETLGLPVLRGRSFTHEEDERAIGTPPAVISRTLARRLFADDDPLGRQVMLRQGSSESGASGHGNATATLTVVGIVPDTTQDILDLEPNSQIYLPFGSRFRSAMWLQATIGAQADEAAMLTSVQRELRRLDEQLPILSARTLAAQRDLSVPRWAVRAAALIFAMFGALALLIAAIGVYGLVAYDVARRTRELGIRMALGATSTDVTRLVLRQGLTAAAVGVSVGLLLAAGIGQVVSSLLYEVSPLDPVALCGAVLVLLGSTLVACYGPARRATRIATVDALRAD